MSSSSSSCRAGRTDIPEPPPYMKDYIQMYIYVCMYNTGPLA